jgi:hypothetical protein
MLYKLQLTANNTFQRLEAIFVSYSTIRCDLNSSAITLKLLGFSNVRKIFLLVLHCCCADRSPAVEYLNSHCSIYGSDVVLQL